MSELHDRGEWAEGQGTARRRPRTRPLVASSAVRAWAHGEGLEVGSVFEPLDPQVVDRYLEHLGVAHPAEQPVLELLAPPVIVAAPVEAAQAAVSAGTCPGCGEPGYLEHIDLKREVRTQRCRPCARWWETPLNLAPDSFSTGPAFT